MKNGWLYAICSRGGLLPFGHVVIDRSLNLVIREDPEEGLGSFAPFQVPGERLETPFLSKTLEKEMNQSPTNLIFRFVPHWCRDMNTTARN